MLKHITAIFFKSVTPDTSSLMVVWDPIAGAASYNVYWATTAGVTTASNVTVVTTDFLDHINLLNGVTYYRAARHLIFQKKSRAHPFPRLLKRRKTLRQSPVTKKFLFPGKGVQGPHPIQFTGVIQLE
jgi:hypothetical protein